MRTRAPGRALVAVAMTWLLAMASAAPAHADEIGLSSDGTTWAGELRMPLLDPDLRWVPGDTETESVWVRNEGPGRARLLIAVMSPDGDQLLADDDVVIMARAAGEDWVGLRNGASAALTGGDLGMRGTLRVDVAVEFRWRGVVDNGTQADVLPVELRITLVESAAVPGGEGAPGGEGPSDDGGLLPDTGTAVPPWLVWLAAALIVGGLALAIGSRRDRRAGQEATHG